MLIHYGLKSYNEAASEAAIYARTKMEQTIESGKFSALQTIQKVQSEIPTDAIVKAQALNFLPDNEGNVLLGYGEEDPLVISDNALTQLCGRADIPTKMFQKLMHEEDTQGWGNQLMAHIFSEMYSHQDKRFLVRSYNGVARGFLSNSYRRLDSRPLLDSFIGATSALGMIPVQGYATETKVMLKSMLPLVFEPVSNEVLCYGATWENSDYGNGAHSIRVFVLRLMCTNYAIADEGIRQIHLGKRLSEDITFSQATYDLDTAASASAINDIVLGSLTPERVEAMNEAIRFASQDKISDPRQYLVQMKTALSKGERKGIAEKYNTPDVELLPPGNTVWRMSNAISLFAQSVDNDERKIELMKLAGTVIPKLAEAA